MEGGKIFGKIKHQFWFFETISKSEAASTMIRISTWNQDPTPFFFKKINLIFTEVQLIYNVVLISAVQQSDSVIHIYIIFLKYSFPLWFIIGYWT